jgi:hypothetical protein
VKREITWVRRIYGANWYRNAFNRFAVAGQAKKVRDETKLMLTQLPKPKPELDGVDNRIAVVMTRIAPSFIDDDNVSGGDFKHIRDEIAEWCGLDDRDRRITFQCMQAPAKRGQYAVRVEIIDDAPGRDFRKELAGSPDNVGSARARPVRGEKRDVPDPRDNQLQLAQRSAWAQLPWDDAGVLTRLAMRGEKLPPIIAITVPVNGTRCGLRPGNTVRLARRASRFDDETIWLYEQPTTERETSNAD